MSISSCLTVIIALIYLQKLKLKIIEVTFEPLYQIANKRTVTSAQATHPKLLQSSEPDYFLHLTVTTDKPCTA